MAGRKRLAQAPKRSAAAAAGGSGRVQPPARPTRQPGRWREFFQPLVERFDRAMHRYAQAVAAVRPRCAGLIASVVLLSISAGYGIVRGDHLPTIVETLKDARDMAANAAGFRITAVEISGRQHLSEAEVLAAAGITARTSLLFLAVDDTRELLESTPRIAEASVRKLYPGRLEISIRERDAFALWQFDRTLYIIADDGTALTVAGQSAVPALPLVVGPGAAARAKELLALLDRYPALRQQLRAAVLVAERRWNLKLKSGLDVRLPETEVGRALDQLVALDAQKKLLSRDLTAIDLRLPDRVSVRLSDEAAQARENAVKEDAAKKKRKGGSA